MSVPNGLAHVKSSKKITLKSISEKKKKTAGFVFLSVLCLVKHKKKSIDLPVKTVRV